MTADHPLDDPQVHITRHYSEYRGDHAADVTTAHAYDPSETVSEMLNRVMGFPLSQWDKPEPTQFVTLQVIVGTEPRETSND